MPQPTDTIMLSYGDVQASLTGATVDHVDLLDGSTICLGLASGEHLIISAAHHGALIFRGAPPRSALDDF